MYQHAQLDENGYVIGISFLNEIDKRPNMFYLEDNPEGVDRGWRRIDGKWQKGVIKFGYQQANLSSGTQEQSE